MQARAFRQRLLRQPGLLAQLPNLRPEGPDEGPVVFAVSHPLTVLAGYCPVDYEFVATWRSR